MMLSNLEETGLEQEIHPKHGIGGVAVLAMRFAHRSRPHVMPLGSLGKATMGGARSNTTI